MSGWTLVAWLAVATGLPACGGYAPEAILKGRQVVLRTPVGDFIREVAALDGPKDAAPVLPTGVEYDEHPNLARDWSYDSKERPDGQLDTELAELREVLAQRVPEWQRQSLTEAYEKYRARVKERDPSGPIRERAAEGEAASFQTQAAKVRQETAASPRAAWDTPIAGHTVPADLFNALPVDWIDYLDGADRFNGGDLSGARQAWEGLLARPQAERLDRSVWAAFMLARMLEDTSSSDAATKSAARYRRVRELRAAGCHDRLNLAAASLGWEGRLALEAKDFSAAARLYYFQARSGTLDRDSLQLVAAAALGHGKEDPVLSASARDPFLRRVVTLYLACSRDFADPVDPPSDEPATTPIPTGPGDAASGSSGEPPRGTSPEEWLAALKTSAVDNLHEATFIAWAAYQSGSYARAADWLKLAPADEPFAVWLHAKLALRDGRFDEAARDFARVAHAFPADPAIGNDADSLIQRVGDARAFLPRQFRMDLGIVQLSRGDCTQAFDSLLRSGFWRDAAYLAERVLTVEELERYVHDHYPAAPPKLPPKPGEVEAPEASAHSQDIAEDIESGTRPDAFTDRVAFCVRYLLARRLARTGRCAEARRYYPAVLLPKFDEYVAARTLGETATASKPRRADGYWRAARIERALGMELFGTENEPDGFVEDGAFPPGDYRTDRLELPSSGPDGSTSSASLAFVPPVGAVEKRRLARIEPQPFKRYHYRYLAADLAWKAAALMPDQQEDTARVLAAGGRWLEGVDATKEADRFYLAILRRCNRTALGKDADASGNIPDVPETTP